MLSWLKQSWQEKLSQWQRRDLAGKRYVYFWVDDVYLETRLEDVRHCILVLIDADVTGHKERAGLWDGYRVSAQSWKERPLEIKSCGLAQGPALAIGGGEKPAKEIHHGSSQEALAVGRRAGRARPVIALSAASALTVLSVLR